MTRFAALSLALWLALPSLALASTTESDSETKFDPSEEWNLHTWGPELKLGPIDMSINKAVAYLLLRGVELRLRVALGRREGERGEREPECDAEGGEARHDRGSAPKYEARLSARESVKASA